MIMEKKTYKKPEIAVFTLAAEASLLEETRVRTANNANDIWIKRGSRDDIQNGGWSFAKRSDWNDDEESLSDSDADFWQ